MCTSQVLNPQPCWSQLFNINDVDSWQFVEILIINITNTLLFFVKKMWESLALLKETTQQHTLGSNPVPLNLESNALPSGQHAPQGLP